MFFVFNFSPKEKKTKEKTQKTKKKARGRKLMNWVFKSVPYLQFNVTASYFLEIARKIRWWEIAFGAWRLC